jgi:hypothetical protein
VLEVSLVIPLSLFMTVSLNRPRTSLFQILPAYILHDLTILFDGSLHHWGSRNNHVK